MKIYSNYFYSSLYAELPNASRKNVQLACNSVIAVDFANKTVKFISSLPANHKHINDGRTQSRATLETAPISYGTFVVCVLGLRVVLLPLLLLLLLVVVVKMMQMITS